MENFADKIAVITGAGSGIGRELALTLAASGANLALLDINEATLAETAELCTNDKITVSVHQCDVTDIDGVGQAASDVLLAHETTSVNLLFNNAGIGLTESFLTGDRALWEKTFDVCWGGVYNCARAFLPLVVASDEGHIINVSSINGMWATIGPTRTHSSYCAAKFAVRGFTEALVTEMRIEAPHVNVSVVMPGHIGTNIVANSQRITARELSTEANERAAAFLNAAPTTAHEAAAIILNGVRNKKWRILVGRDAELLDEVLRQDPENAYESEFVDYLHQQGVFVGLVQ